MARRYLLRNSIFNVLARGLKPNTKHFVFLKGKLVDINLCKPVNSTFGVPSFGNFPITNSNGVTNFFFRLETDLIKAPDFNNPMDNNTRLTFKKNLPKKSSFIEYLILADFYDGDLIDPPMGFGPMGWNMSISLLQTFIPGLSSFAAISIRSLKAV